MKKIQSKLLSLAILGLATFTFGQQVQFGVKAGGGLSNTTVAHGISKERIGMLAGGVVKYQLRDRVEDQYVQAEILYTNQGEYSVDHAGNKYKAYINYINIPIMYKYYFDDQGKDFFLEAGPQIGFKVSDNFDPAGPEYSNHKLKSFDLAINAGVGFSLDRKYELNLRYGYGLVDTLDFNRWDNGNNRTSYLSLAFTYLFD